MAAVSRRLVIDASVASAAGHAQHPNSSRCREFLQTVLKICHRITMTPKLGDEWEKHQSQFARTWIAEMLSQRKVVDIADVHNDQVRKQVSKRKAAQKDVHLIEAALQTDKVVVSLDDRAHTDLQVQAARHVTWVNAVAEGGHAIYW